MRSTQKKWRLLRTYLAGHPLWCAWQVTYRCNFRCRFCHYWADPMASAAEPPASLYADAARKLGRMGTLLVSLAGRRASANGATQIRAGVLRPEIIVPAAGPAAMSAGRAEQTAPAGLTTGSPIRIIREPYFGRLGTVKSLPAAAVAVESEAKVRVVEVQFPDGRTTIVPRANVEAIET